MLSMGKSIGDISVSLPNELNDEDACNHNLLQTVVLAERSLIS